MQLSGSAAFTAMPAGRPAVQRSADISMMAECVARNPPSCTLRAPRLPSHHITSHPAVSLSSRTRHVQNASRTHAHESLTHTPFHHLLLAFIPRSRTPFIAGNWKMNTVLSEAVSLAKEVAAAAEKADGVQVAVCPPFPFIVPVKEALKGSKVGVGAQDCYYEEAGAYTGALRASCCPSHPAAPPPPPPTRTPGTCEWGHLGCHLAPPLSPPYELNPASSSFPITLLPPCPPCSRRVHDDARLGRLRLRADWALGAPRRLRRFGRRREQEDAQGTRRGAQSHPLHWRAQGGARIG